MLYAGRLDREKGIEVLIDAYESLGLPPDGGCLVMAGAPRNHREPEAGHAYAASLRARTDSRSCLWLGWVPDTKALYRAADVTVLPSLTDEPFARVTLEAMASECPVLVSAVGGSPEALTGEFTRYLIPPGDSEALATALAGLRDWRQRCPGLGMACRDHVRLNFPLERAVERIEASLMQVVDARATTHQASNVH